MYYVYIIQSSKNKILYFGRTRDLDKRLSGHNSGSNFSTRDNCPWEYVYFEGYKSEKDAVDRELKLKNYVNARTYIKKRIKHGLS